MKGFSIFNLLLVTHIREKSENVQKFKDRKLLIPLDLMR